MSVRRLTSCEATLGDSTELIHVDTPRTLHILLDDLHLLIELRTAFVTSGIHHRIPLTLGEGDVASRHLSDILARLTAGVSRDEAQRSVVAEATAVEPRGGSITLRDGVVLRRRPDLILVKDVAELMVHDLEEGRIERLRIVHVEPVCLIERDLQPTLGRTLGDRAVAVPRSRADDEELTGGTSCA